MTSPLEVLRRVWNAHIDGEIALVPDLADDVQLLVEPGRRPYHENWKERLAKMQRFFYHLHVTECGSNGKIHRKPYVTICIILDPVEEKASRGVAICHPLDTPNNKKGRQKAQAWAERALYYERDVPGRPQNEEVVGRLMQAVMDSEDKGLYNVFRDFPLFVTFGMYLGEKENMDAPPTLKELAMISRQLLSRKGKLEAMAPIQAVMDLFAKNIDGEEADLILKAWKAKMETKK